MELDTNNDTLSAISQIGKVIMKTRKGISEEEQTPAFEAQYLDCVFCDAAPGQLGKEQQSWPN